MHDEKAEPSAATLEPVTSEVMDHDEVANNGEMPTAAGAPAGLRAKLASMFGRGKTTGMELARQENTRQATLNQLKQGYVELVDTMKSVRQHLDEQSARQERLMAVLDGLPEVLATIPQTTRTQIETLEAIRGSMDRSNQTNEALSMAISGPHQGRRHPARHAQPDLRSTPRRQRLA